MGKPSKADYPGHPPGEMGDAVSLHTTPGTPGASRPPDYRDEQADDEDAPALAADGLDDLPPLYSDAVEGSASSPAAAVVAVPSSSSRYRPFHTDAATGAVAYMEPALAASPRELERHLAELAQTPPRPQLRIVGTHSETERKSDGKSSETRTVTDFALTVEMAPYLYADARHRRSWARLRSVDHDEKVPRGTLFARRGDHRQPPQHVEAGRLVGDDDDKPSLEEWCHRFCASHAGLKCFTLRRRVTGFDLPRVREQLVALVRRTGYRGRVDIDLVTRDARADVYNEARINRWRLTPWVRLLFFCTLLFLLAWPYLWLRTRRWEVVVVDWPFSLPAENEDEDEDGADDGPVRHHRRRPRRYVALSEDQWYNIWARAIHRAVLDRRQKTLDQDDLRAAATDAEPSFETAGVADGAAGLFRAGLSAMNEMNIQMGWGGDR